MISIGLDETLFIQLFLLIIVIIMAKFLYLNPIGKTISARNEKIEGLKSTATANCNMWKILNKLMKKNYRK